MVSPKLLAGCGGERYFKGREYWSYTETIESARRGSKEMLTSESQKNFETMPLYKYMSCGDQKRMEWVKQILVDHQLFFASRQGFNDPFDCAIPNLSQIPGTFLKRFAEDFVERKFPNHSEAVKSDEIDRLMSVNVLEEIQQGLQDTVDKAGISWFSTVRDDILMWAHYADKHQGLCLEFDGSCNCKFFGVAQPVEYEDYTPILLHEDKEHQMNRAILTKSKHWSYEKEYRIFRPDKAGQSMDYPVELLTGIIFGCRTPPAVRASVKQWVREGNCRVAFFEARPKAAEFGLDIVRID
jgi:hypothetical protein